MVYYHTSKQAALDHGDERFGQDWCVAAQLEPGNGWVIILSPKTLAYLKEPLEPLLAEAEIHITHSIRRRPESYKPLPKVVNKPRASRTAPPPSAPPPPPPSRPIAPTVAAAPPPPPPPRPA